MFSSFYFVFVFLFLFFNSVESIQINTLTGGAEGKTEK